MPYDNINIKCQVFTPIEIVKELLDYAGYTRDIYGKTVAENSCGDGAVLSEIVRRYIEDGINQKIAPREIKKRLETDIWGAEIDNEHISKCKSRLEDVTKRFGMSNVRWNIFEGDFLKKDMVEEFDFVIGNPPYITYKELDEVDRKYIRANFETCTIGKFDYCYAFTEASIRSLKKRGKLAYLIPSNIFKNQFADTLRNYLKPHLTNIYEYKDRMLFEGKLTASAIIVCDKDSEDINITYHDLSENKSFLIAKTALKEKWMFKSDEKKTETPKWLRFGDYFHAAGSIATLSNKVYIISDFEECGEFVAVKEHMIEKKLLRRAMSPRSLNQNKPEYIIFPYYYADDGKIQRYTDEEVHSLFPCAEKYLRKFEKELNARDSDKGIRWFEYGRSQALAHLNQEKLMISTLITGSVKVTLLEKDIIPTSGLYIIPKENNRAYTLSSAMTVLRSDLFYEYVKNIGVISNRNSFRISPKDINNFTFPADLVK
jgi:predicted RNA methylase